MEKPTTLSVKNYLIRKLAADMIIPEATIQAVITHQFGTAFSALASNASIEISGFGKFVFDQKRAIKRMGKYNSQKKMYEGILNDDTISPVKRRNTEMRMKSTLDNINILNSKLQNENRLLSDI
jgi:nucleoid DNA-binding protein